MSFILIVTNISTMGGAFMATLNRKERRAQRNESNTIGILLRSIFNLRNDE